jgi:4-amino-4-deoxy-L-arabinose transferase-like glycosyltransferase
LFHLNLPRHTTSFLVLFSTLLFFPGLGARDLWAPVEPRYGEIIRVMFSTGEWLVPRVNGDIYTDKPILYFWTALITAHLFGAVSEWAVRLPAALGGVGFVLATFWIGRELFNARVGAISALICATSLRVIWESRWAHVDMLFGFFFLLSVYFGTRMILRRSHPNEILLAYVFMALATLTKGLIGIVLPGLLFFAVVIARRDWALIRAARLVPGLALFLLVAAPWFYLVSRATDGQWLSDFITIHHLRRYTAIKGHAQPIYYYFATLPLDFFPWTAFLIAALCGVRDYRRAWTLPQLQICLLWFATVFVFFTLSNTKRDLYLIPLLPTLAFVVANYIDRLERRDFSSNALGLWAMTLLFGGIALAGIVLPLGAVSVQPDAVWPLIPSGAALAIGGTAAVVLIARRRPLAAAVSVSVMMMLLTGTLLVWFFPHLERYKSHRQFAQVINARVPAGTPLYIYADNMHHFNFYTRRSTIPVLETAADVEALRDRREKSYVLIKERHLEKLPAIPPERIAASNSPEADWHLVEFGGQEQRK